MYIFLLYINDKFSTELSLWRSLFYSYMQSIFITYLSLSLLVIISAHIPLSTPLRAFFLSKIVKYFVSFRGLDGDFLLHTLHLHWGQGRVLYGVKCV